MRVTAGIAACLADDGVDAVFGVPASETMGIAVAAESLGLRTYHARHEQVAVGMADGYARLTGRPGVVVVGRGPGFTNGLNALVAAAKAGSGVVVVTGELPSDYQGERGRGHLFHMKNVDQAGIARLSGCDTVVVGSPDTVRTDLARALGRARQGQPVVVLLPGDVASCAMPEASERAASPPVAGPVRDADADGPSDGADVDDLVSLLQTTWACQRPLILAGRGAISASARANLLALGDRIGALLATTLMAKDLFAGDPSDLGVLGTLASEEVAGLAMRSDLVLVFGASLHPFTTFGGELMAKARVVQVDADPRAFGRHLEPEMTVQGDAADVAGRVVADLDGIGHRVPGYRTPAVLGLLAAAREKARTRPTPGDPGDALVPEAVLSILDELVEPDRAVVVDAGAHMPAAASSLHVPRPADFCTTALDYMSVGSAFGVALGAAVARPERTTVNVIGDGGLAMVLGDLSTLARYALPVLLVVVNDSAFGQEVQLLQLAGLPDDVARYPTIGFEAVATAMGLPAVTLTTVGDLHALPSALASGPPSVVDLRVPTGGLGAHTSLATRLGRSP